LLLGLLNCSVFAKDWPACPADTVGQGVWAAHLNIVLRILQTCPADLQNCRPVRQGKGRLTSTTGPWDLCAKTWPAHLNDKSLGPSSAHDMPGAQTSGVADSLGLVAAARVTSSKSDGMELSSSKDCVYATWSKFFRMKERQ